MMSSNPWTWSVEHKRYYRFENRNGKLITDGIDSLAVIMGPIIVHRPTCMYLGRVWVFGVTTAIEHQPAPSVELWPITSHEKSRG